MGTVYEAISERTGETVALKVLKAEQVEKKEAVERMRHEATVVSRIRHPNICNVQEMGSVHEGRPFLVMELLRGETLAKRLEREKRIPPTLGVEIALQALAALDVAHRSGVIHRDMKPDNIFLMSGSGVLAKVLDFGISKATFGDDQPHNLTRTGMVMGTPYYMAPEQAMGERQLDARVDVWGVGVLLYEALTGLRPFVAKNYNALLVQILTGNPEPAAVVRAQIPVGLSNAIHRALAKKRDERFATAQEFAKAIAAFRQEWSPVDQEKEKVFRQTARSRAIQVASVVSDPMTPSPSPASRRTVRMAEEAIGRPGPSPSPSPEATSPKAVAHLPDARRTTPMAERPLPLPTAEAVDSSAAPTARPRTEQAQPLNADSRRTTPMAGARQQSVLARGGLVAQTSVPRLQSNPPAQISSPPNQAAGRTAQPGRATLSPSRRRSTEPPKQMATFDTADSSFSVSSSDEEPTQLYDGTDPIGDDSPTIEENDLTVVDAPFLEDYERRSR